MGVVPSISSFVRLMKKRISPPRKCLFLPFYAFEPAERMGFEPMNHFWRLHTFQACAFDHSAISPVGSSQLAVRRMSKANSEMLTANSKKGCKDKNFCMISQTVISPRNRVCSSFSTSSCEKQAPSRYISLATADSVVMSDPPSSLVLRP